MSIPTRQPLRFAQANLTSGNLATGEFSFVRGGVRAATIMSGALAPTLTATDTTLVNSGPDLLLYSGACRLNSVIIHTTMVSGVATIFYDAAVVTSGGPFVASGHKVVGVIPPSWNFGVGSGALLAYAGAPFNFDMPVQSGLCVRLASGQPGFSVSFTPEANPQPYLSGGVGN